MFCSFEFFWENLLHKNAMKITRGVIFVLENYQIVVFFKKKIWGAFWRFLAWKGALPDSELLETLNVSRKEGVGGGTSNIQVYIIFFNNAIHKIIINDTFYEYQSVYL